jgi:epoxyqueuosine reductase
MIDSALSQWIAEKASSLGFDLCGIVSAQKFPELAHTEDWLERGYAGEMNYLADPRRGDPQLAMPGIRSVIVCALNYNTSQPRSIHVAAETAHDSVPRGWISRYAWGSDYHEVLREKLDQLLAELQQHTSEPFTGRTYADTGPLQERILAKYAGLGWLGKNTLLLNQRIGSYFFLGTILTTLELAPSPDANATPPPDLCGSCRRCIEACPTDALEPYVMDARRCISYLTIELRGSIPEEFREPMGNHVFGCDICQDVCPWNNRAPISATEQFAPRVFVAATGAQIPSAPDTTATVAQNRNGQVTQTAEQSLFHPDLLWLANLTQEEFSRLFRGSPIKRTKWRGLVRNACIALGNARITPDSQEYSAATSTLERLANSPEIHIAESAQWALSRIQSKE